jgi:hypothetical protein
MIISHAEKKGKDVTQFEFVQQMIQDWVDELQAQMRVK